MLRLKTFGGLSLERDGVPIEGRVTQRRRLALLAYLAAAGETPSGRDKLIALFWPERDSEHGRHCLSQAIYALRQDLTPDAVLGGIDEVRLNGAVVSSDLAEFHAALNAGDWEAAVARYRGPFLDAVHVDEAAELERWIDGQRQRLAQACADALERLAGAAASREDWAAATTWRRRRLTLTPLDAAATLRLMEALAAQGDRAGAIRQARVHQELLRAELDVGPDPEVARLAEQLRRESAAEARDEPAPAPERPQIPVTASASATAPTASSASPASAWRPLLAAGLLLAAAVLTWAGNASHPRAPTLRPLVVVGDFAGPDSTLALAIREAVLTERAAEPRLRLLSEGSLRSALRLMRRPPTAEIPLERTTALELGRRVGAHFVVLGPIAPLGSGTQVVAQALTPGDGAAVVSLSERPARDEDLVTAVSRLGRTLRARLAREEPDTSANPLPAVTTVSLPALERYAAARQALSRTDRQTALMLGEAALAEDSVFPLAHYLVGDLLWFFDQQAHSEAHLDRALALAEQVPLRERLLIRARYEQLVSDRPDSALAYWQLLRVSHADEALAYEGMSWTLRALGRYTEAAAAADSAILVDSSAVTPNVNNRLYALASQGDTAAALRFVRALPAWQTGPKLEARFLAALQRSDWVAARRFADSVEGDVAKTAPTGNSYRHHIVLLAQGRVEEAARMVRRLRTPTGSQQLLARHLILQGTAELAAGRPASAALLGWEALGWVSRSDLSIPAIARLAERIAALGAWSGDRELVESARRLVLARDRGRGLRSYRLALESMAGCESLLRGDGSRAAEQLAAGLAENFFGRSASMLAVLRADALALRGDSAAARALYQQVVAHQLPDTDFESWPVVTRLAAVRLARLVAR